MALSAPADAIARRRLPRADVVGTRNDRGEGEFLHSNLSFCLLVFNV